MLDGMEDQAVRQVSAVGTVLLVVTRWQIVPLVQREQTALYVMQGAMGAVVTVTVRAQANVQQVDMPLIQQLLVQVQRTALHVRLANMVTVGA